MAKTQKHQTSLLVVVIELQVGVAAGVGCQMPQTLAGLAEQAVVLSFQMGQKYSEQELPVALQKH